MKKQRSATNAVAIQKIAAESGFTERFIRLCIRHERDSATAEIVRKKYKKIMAEIKSLKV